MTKYRLDDQVTYAGMIWLLVAQLAVMLPFAVRLPAWLIPVMATCIGWRIKVVRGEFTAPSPGLKALVAVLGIGALTLSGLPLVSLDAAISLLLLGFAFKSLEVSHKRDALVVLFIGYFLVAMGFLYGQSLAAAMYGAICLVILTGALIGIQQARSKSIFGNLRLASVMLLQCLPLMVVTYLVFPRLPPLWSLPLPGAGAQTGISDTLAPGDIAELTQSDALAFRVTFDGPRPAQNQLYWRGLVMHHFDGRRWTQLPGGPSADAFRASTPSRFPWDLSALGELGPPLAYQVIYEKTAQPWLFTLTPPLPAGGEVIPLFDFRLLAKQDLNAAFALRVVSYPNAKRGATLDPKVRKLSLQLPPRHNPRILAQAKRWRQTTHSDLDYIHKIMDHYRQEPFTYSLKPGVLEDKDSVDQFFFGTRKGFCAHYAQSLVVLMRAAEIPARIIIGYQGGEWNARSRYLAVHQYDAHAWVEAWIDGQGWIRFDPTAQVAPERVEAGLESAVANEGTFLQDRWLSPIKIKWLDGMRMRLDAIQYAWRRWVIGYDSGLQSRLMEQFIGAGGMVKMAMIVGAVFAAILLFWWVILGMARPAKKRSAHDKLYAQFLKRLQRLGVTLKPTLTPREVAAKAVQKKPKAREDIQSFFNAYEAICYIPDQAGNYRKHLASMKRAWRRLKWRR